MKWIKYTLETTTEAVDLVADMLIDLGIEGIEIKDKVQLSEEDQKKLFIDILPELGEDDGLASVSFYTEDGNQGNLLDQIKVELESMSSYVDVGTAKITISETEDKDWINNWKEFFKPFRIDDTIVIKPTWEELTGVNEGDLVIEIDPGTSFGTGAHETTKLCILGLKKYMKEGYDILDAGSGSGILSIIAKKLGAKNVLGIDIDELATAAAIENAKVNGLDAEEIFLEDMKENEEKLNFITGNIISDQQFRQGVGKERFDLVVANILADVIIPLSDIIGENMKAGAIFISSGIINMKEEAVKEALLRNNFTILEINYIGDWVSFVAQK